MDLTTIGKNIRKYRTEKGMRQEVLAEKTNLTPNYIGMLERSDKIPSLATLIRIANALDVTSDMLLCDILDNGYKIKNSLLLDRISKLPEKEQMRIYAVIETLLAHAET